MFLFFIISSLVKRVLGVVGRSEFYHFDVDRVCCTRTKLFIGGLAWETTEGRPFLRVMKCCSNTASRLEQSVLLFTRVDETVDGM
jgi:hypothetical protein